MPHKVNPIDFENAEGNFGIANALFGFLAAKLPISRLQRDLSDSTVSRTIGMTVGHAVAGKLSNEPPNLLKPDEKAGVSMWVRKCADVCYFRWRVLLCAFAGLWALQLGLSKITVNEAALAADLDDNWAVVAEAIQTILRREGCVFAPMHLASELMLCAMLNARCRRLLLFLHVLTCTPYDMWS